MEINEVSDLVIDVASEVNVSLIITEIVDVIQYQVGEDPGDLDDNERYNIGYNSESSKAWFLDFTLQRKVVLTKRPGNGWLVELYIRDDDESVFGKLFTSRNSLSYAMRNRLLKNRPDETSLDVNGFTFRYVDIVCSLDYSSTVEFIKEMLD